MPRHPGQKIQILAELARATADVDDAERVGILADQAMALAQAITDPGQKIQRGLCETLLEEVKSDCGEE
jgi:hypothetical protein